MKLFYVIPCIILYSICTAAYVDKLDIIGNKYTKLKLLGDGDVKVKFDIEVNSISKKAKEKVEKLGGKITLIK